MIKFFNDLAKFIVLGCLISGLVGTSAHAAGDNAAKKEEKEINRSVELNALVLPVFDEDMQLKNYLFVNARMLVVDGKGVWNYREKAHIIRDAVLRASHRESVHLEGNYLRLDEHKAREVFLKAANEVLGETAFDRMVFLQVASQNMHQ